MLTVCRRCWLMLKSKNIVISRTSVNKMATPSVEVSPKVALVDEKIRVRAVNLQPSQEVTLQAWVSERGAVYTSCGQFVVDGQGCVDTTQHSSLGGTYSGVDDMGLFWSLRAAKKLSTRLMKKDVSTPLEFYIRVLNGHVGFDNLPDMSDSVLASTTCERWYKHQSVRRVVVREGKLRGTLFLPPGQGPFQGVIDMFGTAGGLIEVRAALLASRGFASFALAYFEHDDLPKTIKDLDLRYFLDAVDWLSSHPSVEPDGVGVVGVSKGGELGFVLASVTDKVKAVVNINGSPAYAFEDLFLDGKMLLEGIRMDPSGLVQTEDGVTTQDGFSLQSYSLIPVWQNDAKVLYMLGEEDGTWRTSIVPTLFYSEIPSEKRKNFEIVMYPKAGHLLEPPYMPLCRSSYYKPLGISILWGGQPKPHAEAQEDAWKKLLKFLNENLRKKHSVNSKL